MSDIHDNIKRLRLQNNITLAELAKMIGVKEATAQRYESGEIKNIKHKTIVNLANIFNVKPSIIMGWEEENSGYYTDPEVTEYANQLKNNPDLRLLFDAATDMTKNDIDFVVNMIENLKKRKGK